MGGIVCRDAGKSWFALESLDVRLMQPQQSRRLAVVVEIVVEDHPLHRLAAKFDQTFGTRPLRGKQQNAGVAFADFLRKARRIEGIGDQHYGIRSLAQRIPDDSAAIDIRAGFEGDRHYIAATCLKLDGKVPQPALAIGAVLRVMNRHDMTRPALREVIVGARRRLVPRARHDQEKRVVEAKKIVRGNRRTDQNDTRLLGKRQDNFGHCAGHRPDDRLDPRRDQFVNCGDCLLGTLGVIADNQFDLATIDATGTIDLFDGNLGTVAPGLAQIGDASAQAAEEADA